MRRAIQQLAASVLCVGFDGETLTAKVRDQLAALKPGAIILFARNVTALGPTRALVDRIVALYEGGLPPLICIDQEGGRVARLRTADTMFPSAMALGGTGDVVLAEAVGRSLGAGLRRAGITLNFAPVVDLALEANNTVIGTRAFGDDPAQVGALGAAMVRGFQAEGLAATLKHFPGHGATTIDSHIGLPVVDVAPATLRSRDLVPFALGIAAGARAVMTAHVVVRAIDAERPATLSSAILTDLLRGELHFEGVACTDCLEMTAIAGGIGTVEGAVTALAAGADCLTISHHLDVAYAAHAAIVDAVDRGVVARTRLEEAATRVGRLRATLAATSPATATSADGSALARLVAERAITVVRRTGNRFLDSSRVTNVISFEGATQSGAEDRREEPPALHLALRRRRVRSESLRVTPEPLAEQIEQLAELVRAQPDRQTVIVMRRAHVHPSQRAAIDVLLTIAPDAIVISAAEPFDAPCFPQAGTVLCTYGDDALTIEALADVLTGRIEAVGRLPVSFSDRA